MILNYKHWTIVGLLDSDGTFTLRLLQRKNNKLGVSVLCSFTQQTSNSDVLTPLVKQLGITSKIIDTVNQQGKRKSRLDVFLPTPPGKNLQALLRKKKPFNPGKRRDYLISCKLLEYVETRTFKQLKNIELSLESQERVASVICVILAYNKTYKIDLKKTANTKIISQEEWLNFLQPTQEEMKLGQKLASNFLEKIEENVKNLEKRLTSSKIHLPHAYVLGFHLGDGCLTVGIMISTKTNKLATEPSWYLDEDLKNEALMHGFQSTFQKGSVKIEKNKSRYKLTGWKSCNDFVLPFLGKYFLPKARQKQFNCFKQCCELGRNSLQLTPSGLLSLLEISWNMNDPEGKETGKSQRKTTKEEMKARIEHYFSNASMIGLRNRVLREQKKKFNFIFSFRKEKE